MVTMHDFRQANDLNMRVPGFEPSLIWSEGAKFKLMCEFMALPNGKAVLRLEYDSCVLSANQIQRLQLSIQMAMRLISSGSCHEEIKKTLRDMQVADSEPLSSKCYFGKTLRDI
jgi:hypothetical protein